jgi:nicotinamidase/pyrazinamidase
VRQALIIVDVQKDFCPGGALAVPRGDEVVPVANLLLERFELAVLTQDWHPAGHCSFASTFGKAPYSPDDSSDPPGILWPDHCVAGSSGADFHPDLAAVRANLILRKGRRPDLDSYSAFFENDGFTSTGLHGWLGCLGVESLVILGLATDYCVKATALDARRLGYSTNLVLEGIRGVDATKGDVDRALELMESRGVRVLPLSRLDFPREAAR